jgi:RNA ligase
MSDLTAGGAVPRPLLADVLDVAELEREIADDKVNRRRHPALPLSIYAYGRSCQYEQN